ncbi:MAG: cytochrome c peroxidase [Verrucomicrobiota bacterium]
MLIGGSAHKNHLQSNPKHLPMMNPPNVTRLLPSLRLRSNTGPALGSCLLLAALALIPNAWGQGAPIMDDLFLNYSIGTTQGGDDMHEFDLDDRQNRFLIIEESTNNVDWTEVGSFKITNTEALVGYAPPISGHPHIFFRFNYDPAQQVPNDESNILDLPTTPYNYTNFPLPAHFQVAGIQNIDNTPAGNPTTDAGATLGRVLFYDKRFSINNTISCASCHIQELGFTDGVDFSVGFEGGLTGRNSMGLANSKYYNNGRFFWDERANTLEDQTSQPIQDAVEMGSAFPDVINEIAAEPYYQSLFAAAFPGDPTPSQTNMENALAQFVRSMVSYESKYDEGVATNFANFTAEEELGRQLFNTGGGGRTNCARCHQTDIFVQPQPRNNGLDLVTTDPGLGGVTGNPGDDGEFKSSSLRNIELTAPYMHDGRFATLEDVVRFYSTDVQAHPNLHPRLINNNTGLPRTPNYTDAEVDALVAFMKTFTDHNFTSDPRWSDPFNYSGEPAPDPTFIADFPITTPLPIQSAITSITVGGLAATILHYDRTTGMAELLFDDSSFANGEYPALLSFTPVGGSLTTVTSTNTHTIGSPPPPPSGSDNNILLLILDDWAIDRSPIDNTIPPADALPNMPNLQSMAANGLRFTRAYVNPVCSPTRASLITGRYAHQTGVYTPGGAISTAEVTLPEAFTAAGSSYAMASMGKWHLGSGDTGYNTTGGWPEFYGITGGGVPDYFSWNKNTNGVTANTTTYTTTDQVNEALAFIDRSETDGDPWFCWVAFNAPHSPFHDPPAGLAPPGGYSPQAAGESANAWNYRKMLEALDTELGRLLAGIDQNETNVILIGDNGTPGQVVQAPFGNGHSKGDLYNGGIHVPLVIQGPAVTVTPGSTTDTLVHAVDLYSTILELAKIDPTTVAPPTALAQSTSIVPILNGTDTADRTMIAEGGNGNNRGRAIITDDFPDYKLIIFHDPENPTTPVQEFYNVGAPANDINEQSPLTIATLTGTALDAYNACIAADAALGGGFLAP